MSIDVQVLRKNLASGIQQHIQRINYCYQVEFIPAIQGRLVQYEKSHDYIN